MLPGRVTNYSTDQARSVTSIHSDTQRACRLQGMAPLQMRQAQ